ncbi:unnamed protein product [Brugia pahangi]|uniref:Uncharacterized protein n=1 Tax=Brugia pahangi TaxID=6280 RepID=A0A0N4TTE3_BRUPA|nr:unnamed protein product [Brugia pahangi]
MSFISNATFTTYFTIRSNYFTNSSSYISHWFNTFSWLSYQYAYSHITIPNISHRYR